MSERFGVLGTAIGQRIREARLARIWSLTDLAERADIARAHIWKLEQGDGNPSITTLAAIAEALGRPLDWFLRPVRTCPTCRQIWPEDDGNAEGDECERL